MNKVALIDADQDIEKAVHTALNLIGGFYPPPNSTVVIKPNLCTTKKSNSAGATTDIRIVEALITYLFNHGEKFKIKIVEADSDGSAELAFKRHGYEELKEKYKVELINLSRDKTSKLILPDGRKLRTFEISSTLLFMDYFISVAKLKRHVFERYSGIWKNQYGCIPNKSVRLYLHPFLTEVLYDINTVFWPDLSIIDGIIGLQGPGPIEGVPKKVNKIICSKNPLSADVVGAQLAGIDYKRVPHLNYAMKYHKDSKEIFIVGSSKISTSDEFKFISRTEYILYRLGLKLRRLGMYLENAGDISTAGAFALRAMGVKQLAGGNVLSNREMVRELKDLLLKFETSKRLQG